MDQGICARPKVGERRLAVGVGETGDGEASGCRSGRYCQRSSTARGQRSSQAQDVSGACRADGCTLTQPGRHRVCRHDDRQANASNDDHEGPSSQRKLSTYQNPGERCRAQHRPRSRHGGHGPDPHRNREHRRAERDQPRDRIGGRSQRPRTDQRHRSERCETEPGQRPEAIGRITPKPAGGSDGGGQKSQA